jgi:aminopeptidase-like protein
MTELREQERAFNATIVFRIVSTTPTSILAGQLPRRERWILLLLDGKRCIVDLAHLTQRSELDVAHTLARLLQSGYIKPLEENFSQ